MVRLDELSWRTVSGWTRERHLRWPATVNPHLLVNRWTAVDPAAAITPDTLHKSCQGTGVPMQTARQDRILHEAFEAGILCT
ncbi:hypothetical protein [Streptomyces tsukubensis]|uniref:hypothetical protein n=1 Tax=Streptomyces tsukubensis TaxID=83656 RepID=UPI00344D41EF